jgi:nitrogenase-associated protein
MAEVTFYEKPGCINNTRQKKLMKEAGHHVEAKNLLVEPWTAAKLLAFFNNLPVNAWFNQSAPAVKSGELDPELLTAEQAIRCMLADPLLIRRPLMEVGDTKIVGFDHEQMNTLFDIKIGLHENLETCIKDHTQTPCEPQQ